MKGKRGGGGWLKRNTVRYEVCLHLVSWNHDCMKREEERRREDLPKTCQFMRPAGTCYSGNRHTQTHSVVAIDAWFIYTVSITWGCSPHERHYLSNVINWINYICLKCSHSQASFPSLRGQLWLISVHRCRKPTSAVMQWCDTWAVVSIFYSLSKTVTLCSLKSQSIFIIFHLFMDGVNIFIWLGIRRAANLFYKGQP